MQSNLSTANDVIEALGGTKPTCLLLGVTGGAVSIWRVRNSFPPHTFPIISRELMKRGTAADLALWRWDRKKKAVGE